MAATLSGSFLRDVEYEPGWSDTANPSAPALLTERVFTIRVAAATAYDDVVSGGESPLIVECAGREADELLRGSRWSASKSESATSCAALSPGGLNTTRRKAGSTC